MITILIPKPVKFQRVLSSLWPAMVSSLGCCSSRSPGSCLKTDPDKWKPLVAVVKGEEAEQ